MTRFSQDVAAFTEALGPYSGGVILPLSQVDWPSEAARDEFILALIGGQDGQAELEEKETNL